MSKNILKLSLVAATMAMVTGHAHSAAFQLAEQNATGLGRAFAGEGAIGDNAAVLGRNPAAMTLFDGPALSVGAIYINPDVDVEGKGSTAQLGQAGGLPTSSKDIADSAVAPFFYYVQPVNEQWALGFGAFTNYGLSTDYQENHYAGPVAGKTDLLTLNLNPNVAFRVNESLSLGAGFNAVYADAELTRHAGISAIPAAGVLTNSEIVHLTGDDWGYGWNAGLLLEADENNRWGITYRSKVDLTLKGEYSSAIPTGAPGTPVGTGGINRPGSLDLSLPAIAEFSGFHQVQPDWALHYGVMWTEWRTFKELRALDPQGGTYFDKEEGFKDSWRFSVGTTHQLNEQLTLRAGLAYDNSPVPEEARSISIPDVDRTWYTVGATYDFNDNLSMDAAFAFLDGKKVTVNEAPFEFESGGDAYLFGLQMNYAF